MDGTPVHNKQKTTCPLKVALADGRRLMSTHICGIIIPGLPTTLVGHIVPELSITPLFGIRVLTEAGCTVTFDTEKCVVNYNGKIILVGMKDPTTDLWTLLIVGPADKTSPIDTPEQHDAFVNLRDESMEGTSEPTSSTPNELGLFSHTVRTKANNIKFAHQSMCSPRITYHDIPQSNPKRLPQRVPQSLRQRSNMIPQH